MLPVAILQEMFNDSNELKILRTDFQFSVTINNKAGKDDKFVVRNNKINRHSR